jgi:DNA-binding transcriptional LysR family regulator
MEPSLTALRVLRAVAERGSFTAAAADLGYTQSGVSRQVAALEREAATVLFERHAAGVRLTTNGLIMLRHARVILDEIASAERELKGTDTGLSEVRLGTYITAGAIIVPGLLRLLRNERPEIRVFTREGTTPALVRALRAGTLDLAVIGSRPPFRPPDDELPALATEVIHESTLVVAASATGRFAGRRAVSVDELEGVDWIASPSARGETLLGVWPGLPGRPRVVHTVRDWLTKLQLVAAGCGLTTVPPNLAHLLPEGVQLMRVEGGPQERRRALAARMPGKPSASVAAVIAALRAQYAN